MRYILLYGRLTARKPSHYCELHKCGITKKHSKKRCWQCIHLLPMTQPRAMDITVKGRYHD